MGALTHNGEVLQRLPADASQINFDNTGTNLNSTQTENAIKEVNTKVNTNTEDITQLKSGLTSVNVNVTNSDKLAEGSALWCMRMGKVVVVEYYLIIATDCVANDVLATLDLPANFSINYFNDRLNLKNNTKTLTADSNITTGTTIKGQLVGITH